MYIVWGRVYVCVCLFVCVCVSACVLALDSLRFPLSFFQM